MGKGLRTRSPMRNEIKGSQTTKSCYKHTPSSSEMTINLILSSSLWHQSEDENIQILENCILNRNIWQWTLEIACHWTLRESGETCLCPKVCPLLPQQKANCSSSPAVSTHQHSILPVSKDPGAALNRPSGTKLQDCSIHSQQSCLSERCGCSNRLSLHGAGDVAAGHFHNFQDHYPTSDFPHEPMGSSQFLLATSLAPQLQHTHLPEWLTSWACCPKPNAPLKNGSQTAWPGILKQMPFMSLDWIPKRRVDRGKTPKNSLIHTRAYHRTDV